MPSMNWASMVMAQSSSMGRPEITPPSVLSLKVQSPSNWRPRENSEALSSDWATTAWAGTPFRSIFTRAEPWRSAAGCPVLSMPWVRMSESWSVLMSRYKKTSERPLRSKPVWLDALL